MGTSETDLQKHDEWALGAVEAVSRMAPDQQRSLLMHVFRVAAHHSMTNDPQDAVELCQDLCATVDLHTDEAYVKAISLMSPPDRSRTVSIEEALAALSTP
jgi:hypothetical protein